MVANYERIFGQKPRNASSPLVKVITQKLLFRAAQSRRHQDIPVADWCPTVGSTTRKDRHHYSSDDNVKIPCSTSTRTYGSCETYSDSFNKMKHANGYVQKNPTIQTSQRQVRLGEHMLQGSKEEVPDDAPHLVANE
jgi:hypothetical protein